MHIDGQIVPCILDDVINSIGDFYNQGGGSFYFLGLLLQVEFFLFPGSKEDRLEFSEWPLKPSG